MVWKNIKVGIWDLKYTPISPTEKEYIDVDEKGNILKRVSGTFTRGYFVNEATGEQHAQAFKLINGKPLGKLSLTKVAVNYKEVEQQEVEDLIIEKQYLVECDPLLKDLKDSRKALKFGYTSGNGFKVYFAYVFPSQYAGFLEMVLGTTKKSEVILGIMDNAQKVKKAKQIEIQIQQVDKAKVEDLLQL